MRKFILPPENVEITHKTRPVTVRLEIEKLTPIAGNLFYKKATLRFKGRKCIFVWDKSRFPKPLIVFPLTRKGDPDTILFVQTVVSNWETHHIIRENPRSGPKITPARAAYISKLIKGGHIRRPHLKQFKGHSSLILVNATLVNPTNIISADLPAMKDIVTYMNSRASVFHAANPGVSRGSFNTWVKEEMI